MSITGERLRMIRKRKGKSLMQVGSDLNISYSNLAAVERGEQNCNSTTLKTLADYYGVTTDYLIGKTDDANNSPLLAFYDQTDELTDAQKNEVRQFIEFIKKRDGA